MENNKLLYQLLAEPGMVRSADIPLLKEMADRFPYAQPIHMLLARAEAQHIPKAALYNHGDVLYQVLNQPEVAAGDRENLTDTAAETLCEQKPFLAYEQALLTEDLSTEPLENEAEQEKISSLNDNEEGQQATLQQEENPNQVENLIDEPKPDFTTDETKPITEGEVEKIDAAAHVDEVEKAEVEASSDLETLPQADVEEIFINPAVAEEEEWQEVKQDFLKDNSKESENLTEHHTDDILNNPADDELQHQQKKPVDVAEEPVTPVDLAGEPSVLADENLTEDWLEKTQEAALDEAVIENDKTEIPEINNQSDNEEVNKHQHDEQEVFEEIGEVNHLFMQHNQQQTAVATQTHADLDFTETDANPPDNNHSLPPNSDVNTSTKETFFASANNEDLPSEVAQEETNKEGFSYQKEDLPLSNENYIESVASADFFAFEQKMGADTSVTPPHIETVLPDEPEILRLSKYDDDQLPYTFLWWLAKTRKEHEQIFQPYVQVKPQGNRQQSKHHPEALDFQQQYVEHIFHLQTPFEVSDHLADFPKGEIKDTKGAEIIERFLKEDPTIKPPKPEQIDTENKAKKSAEDRYDLVSETLAKIYIEQMLYHKAIDTYKKLSLKYPEKSRYFADLIQSIEKKI